MKTKFSRLFALGASLALALSGAGCATTVPPSRQTPVGLHQPTITFPVVDLDAPPSRSWKSMQEHLDQAAPIQDLKSASDVEALLDYSLGMRDLEPDEILALTHRRDLTREAVIYYRVREHVDQDFMPAVAMADSSAKPYTLEALFQAYLAEVTDAQHQLRQSALTNDLDLVRQDIKGQLEQVEAKILNLESAYRGDLAGEQRNFIQICALDDFKNARDHYEAGKGLFWNNDVEIACALRPLNRVLRTATVNSAIRDDAADLNRQVVSELWSWQRNRELCEMPALPDYTSETGFPRFSEVEMREFVSQNWRAVPPDEAKPEAETLQSLSKNVTLSLFSDSPIPSTVFVSR